VDAAAEQKPVDLRSYATAIWRRKWILVAVLIALPVAVYAISRATAKTYESSTLLEVSPTSVDSAQGANQGGPTAQFIAIAARIIQTSGVAQRAAQQLPGSRSSSAALLRSVSVATDPNTGFITITAKAGTPARAAEIANAFGAAINSARASEAVAQLSQQIAGLNAQISALPSRALNVRNQLIVQRERLRAELAAQGANAQIIEPATPQGSPVSPRPIRNAALALVVALVLGLGLVALAEGLDRRIRRPDELEEQTGLPVLGSVPRSAFKAKADAPRGIEAFRSVRANLTFFNVDHDVSSVVVTSGRQAEGKTSVAVGLAKAYAFSGSDVILVDADLRRPAVAKRFGVESRSGLADVLIGKAESGDALVDLVAPGQAAGRLRILPGGDVPPNPAELLGSQRMHRLIEELSTMCDMLVIDTSPLLAVSDALPLLDEVSGTVLITRLGVAQRDDFPYLKKVLGAAHSRSLGIVVTGLNERNSYPYEYIHATGSPNGAAKRPLTLVGRRRSKASAPQR
jgi:succinoglycan biosynthesis transport protein ExoP